MSDIRTYLEEKAALPENEWLRREPRATHPEIQRLVDEFVGGCTGIPYDDDTERYVEAAVGDLPEHEYHGHDNRHRLTYQLGRECYIAKHVLRDREAAEALAQAQAEGFVLLKDADVHAGERYLLRLGVLYSGRDVPDFGEVKSVRAVEYKDRIIFLPKGARTRGFVPSGPALIKVAA